jgi:hypothetical protein
MGEAADRRNAETALILLRVDIRGLDVGLGADDQPGRELIIMVLSQISEMLRLYGSPTIKRESKDMSSTSCQKSMSGSCGMRR